MPALSEFMLGVRELHCQAPFSSNKPTERWPYFILDIKLSYDTGILVHIQSFLAHISSNRLRSSFIAFWPHSDETPLFKALDCSILAKDYQYKAFRSLPSQSANASIIGRGPSSEVETGTIREPLGIGA